MDNHRINDIIDFIIQIIAGVFGFAIMYTISASFFWGCGGACIAMLFAVVTMLLFQTNQPFIKTITIVVYFVILGFCFYQAEYSNRIEQFSEYLLHIFDEDNPWTSEAKALQFCDENKSLSNYTHFLSKYPSSKNKDEIKNDIFKIIKRQGEKGSRAVLDFSGVNNKQNTLKVNINKGSGDKMVVLLKRQDSENLIKLLPQDVITLPFGDYELAYYKTITKDSIYCDYYRISAHQYGISLK